MHFSRPRHKRGMLGLDMTPIIDCVFNLLIFFALSFNFGVKPGIKVKLPEATADILKKEKKEMIVSISGDGTITLEGGKKVSISELSREFRTLYKMNPDAMVIVQGDEEALHGKIVSVMDAAKSVGLNKLAIATRPKEK